MICMVAESQTSFDLKSFAACHQHRKSHCVVNATISKLLLGVWGTCGTDAL